MKHKFIPLLLLFSISLLSGCYDQREIDETAYIVALGIDKSEVNRFQYTFQFSKPLAVMGENESSSENPETDKQSSNNATVSILTISAPDFYIAKNMTNNYLSKNVDMSHLKLIVFSANIDAAELEDHSRLLLRERQVRPHTAIAVAAESASDYLENVNPELESNTSKYYELMSLRSNNVYTPTKRLHDFVDELNSGTGDTVLPIAIKGSMQPKFPKPPETPGWASVNQSRMPKEHSVLYGMAIFRNGRLTHALDGDTAMIFNILNRNIEDCSITLQNKYFPQETISFRLIIPQKMCAKINIKQKEINVTQNFRLKHLSGILPNGFKSHEELHAYAQEVITRRITDFFTLISRNEPADIMNLRNQTRINFQSWTEWNNFDWSNFYKTARFVVSVNIIQEV